MKILSVLLALLMSIGAARAVTLPEAPRFSYVIGSGDLSLAREWLDAGLSPDFEGSLIGTGLMIGAWEDNIPMMELFLARGADINMANSIGEQALMHAAWKGHLAAVRWLVERGAGLNRQGKQWAALHYAAFAGHVDVVAYLIERGADVNGLSTNGSTALMMAAREGKEGIARALLAAGARSDIVNEWGDDALKWAMRHNNLKIAREIAGQQRFAAAAERPKVSWGPEVRSRAVPDRADALLAQARRMEASGRRDEALRLYRAAIRAIHQVEAVANPPRTQARAATGMTITARRDKPQAQSAALDYAAPAFKGDKPDVIQSTGSIAGADEAAALRGGRATDALPVATDGDTASAAAANPGSSAVDDWLRRARALEAAGYRKQALQAYRQAADVLRGSGRVPASSPRLP